MSVAKSGFLRTDLVERMPFEPSSLGGKREKIHINRGTDFETTPERLSIKRLSVCSLLFSLGVYHSPSSPSLPPLISRVIFHSSSSCSTITWGLWPEKQNVSSCFGCTMADTLPLCHNSTIIFPDKSPARIDLWKWDLEATNLPVDAVTFLQRLDDDLWYFTSLSVYIFSSDSTTMTLHCGCNYPESYSITFIWVGKGDVIQVFHK